MTDEQDPTPPQAEVERAPKTGVEIIYAGGTISSLATEEGHREGGHDVDLVAMLQEHFPEVAEMGLEIGEKQTAFTGLSENMNPTHWESIDEAIDQSLTRNPRGVMITHGTDSMEQTALHLSDKYSELLRENGTSIILTGANDDLETEGTDAWDNLMFALASASASESEDHEPGVYVAFHGRLIKADDVVKLPYVEGGESTFISRSDDAFRSALETQKVRSASHTSNLEQIYGKPQDEALAIDYDVNVIRQNHQELLDYVDSHDVKAIVLTLYHSGTANTEDEGSSVVALVETLRERGIVVFGATENGEPADLHAYETSVKLREAGVVPLYDMPKDVALAKLRLLGAADDPKELIEEMLRSKTGEIDESRVIKEDVDALISLYGH